MGAILVSRAATTSPESSPSVTCCAPSRQGPVEGTHVAAWMTRDPETVDVSESTGQAAAVMIHGGFRHLPVLDGGKPVGIVSIRDLMRVVVDDESPRGV